MAEHPELKLSDEAIKAYKGMFLAARTEKGMTMGLSEGMGLARFVDWAKKNNIPPEIMSKLNPTGIEVDKDGNLLGGRLEASAEPALPAKVALSDANPLHDGFENGLNNVPGSPKGPRAIG